MGPTADDDEGAAKAWNERYVNIDSTHWLVKEPRLIFDYNNGKVMMFRGAADGPGSITQEEYGSLGTAISEIHKRTGKKVYVSIEVDQ